ncbi:MAG: FG-GAP-like repeat-containing protein [Candidatus Cloacimonetes bacterium]|nr:FG-GAP-like repeat-containing protein [Candidatus Cloacimonadota bacterium]MCF7868670.1 FG-GAP-like repeat-containing protein [Candidatus Cloacimonadota bacterium]
MRRIIVILLLLIYNFLNSQNFQRIHKQETHLTSYLSSSYGCTWVDIDNNNLPDIFITNGASQTNMLYYTHGIHQIMPYFHTALNILDLSSFAASWADYDNDGYTDLFVVNDEWHGVDLYHNLDGITFEIDQSNLFANTAGCFYGCAWGDYDNDGLIDLIITDWQQDSSNILLHNDSNGNFSYAYNGLTNDIDQMVCPTWIDYDDDGDIDMFIATDYFNHNILYENDGTGNFSRIYNNAIVNELEKSSTASWADYDNDGDFDLFVGTTGDENNNLYRNDGNGAFTEIYDLNVVNNGGYSRSSCWGDFDNNGFIDLYVANGYLSQNKNNFLYMNNGDGAFDRITQGSIVQDGGTSLGVSAADYDMDGDLDLFVVNGSGYCDQINFFYENISEPSHNWLKIKCEGTVSNRSAIGTKLYVYVTIRGKQQILSRYISSNSGRAAQNDLVVHFGLGNVNHVDSLVVKWPSGIHETINNPRINRLHRIVENSSDFTYIQKRNSVIISNIYNYPNPFNPTTMIFFELTQNSEVQLTIYNMLGQKITTLVDENLEAGQKQAAWNGTDREGKKVTSGIYFYELHVKDTDYTSTKKMILLK